MADEPEWQQFAAAAKALSDDLQGTTLPVARVFAASDIALPETLDLSGDDASGLEETLAIDPHATEPVVTQPSRRRRGAPTSVGRYELIDELGRGGMGVVHLARDPELRREVAVKVVAETRSLDHVQLARFVAEAQITSQLDHPNIVPVHDMGVTPDGELFFVMKRVQGVELAHILRQLREGDPDAVEEWTEHRLLTAFVKVCQGVAYAHRRGVLHRDLKPANVMLGAFGEVLVMDWGVARLLAGRPEETRRDSVERATVVRTLDGVTIGTPGYMSPEQARGEIERLDTRSDVFSLGAILYELLTLCRAYQASSIPALLYQTVTTSPAEPSERSPERGIHPQIDAICMRALEPDAGLRFTDAEELSDAVEDYIEGSERRAKDERRLKRRNRVAAGAAVILAAAAVFLFAQWRAAERAEADTQAALQETRVRTLLAEAAAPALAADPARQLSLIRAGAATAQGLSGGTLSNDVVVALHRAVQPSSLSLELPSTSAVLATAFTPSGAMLAAGQEDGRLLLWAADTGLAEELWTNPRGAVRALAWSGDGKILAAGGHGGEVFLYDLEERVVLPSLATGESATSALALSDDGALLAIGSGPTATLYELDPRKERWTRGGDRDWIHWMAFAGDHLVTDGGGDGPGVWRLDDGTRRVLAGAEGGVTAAHAANGRLAAGFSSGAVGVWSIESGKRVGWEVLHRSTVKDVALDPTGEKVASGDGLGAVRIGAVDDLERAVRLRGHRKKLSRVAWSPSGDRLATAAFDRSVRIWSVDGAPLGVLRGHSGWINALEWRPSGEALASASSDGTIRLWRPSSAGPVRSIRQRRPLTDLAVSPDGTTLALAGDDGRVRLYGMGGDRRAKLEGPGLVARSLTWSPSGEQLAYVGGTGGPQVWSSDGQKMGWPKDAQTAWSTAWAPAGRRVAATDLSGGLRVWNSETFAPLAEARSDVIGGSTVRWGWRGQKVFVAHNTRLTAYDAASGDSLWAVDTAGSSHNRFDVAGDWLVTEGSEPGVAVVRNAENGEALQTVPLGAGELVALATDKDTVAAATEGGDLVVFERTDGSEQLRAPLDPDIRRLALDGEAGLLAAALSGGEVRVWDLRGGEVRTSFVVPGGELVALEFVEAERLWTGSEDGTVHLWAPSSRPRTDAVGLYSGTRSNVRVCKDTLRPVAVLPFPPSDTVWAPTEVCGD